MHFINVKARERLDKFKYDLELITKVQRLMKKYNVKHLHQVKYKVLQEIINEEQYIKKCHDDISCLQPIDIKLI
jgi:hypothetical protein